MSALRVACPLLYEAMACQALTGLGYLSSIAIKSFDIIFVAAAVHSMLDNISKRDSRVLANILSGRVCFMLQYKWRIMLRRSIVTAGAFTSNDLTDQQLLPTMDPAVMLKVFINR